jgi:hypothetical protein
LQLLFVSYADGKIALCAFGCMGGGFFVGFAQKDNCPSAISHNFAF